MGKSHLYRTAEPFLTAICIYVDHKKGTEAMLASISDLLKNSLVLDSLEEAWADSLPNDPDLRHEEGGWVFQDIETWAITIVRAEAGSIASLDLTAPDEVPGSVVVATFHTHPNPSVFGWEPGPSAEDTESAFVLGVPCIIRSETGIYTTGRGSRRGGIKGNPGYPD